MPHIDEHLIEGCYVAVMLRRLEADYAGCSINESDPPSRQIARIDSADAGETYKPIFVYMRNHQTDLIHVRRDHDAFTIFRRPAFVDDQVT